jgi:hypothetical protein
VSKLKWKSLHPENLIKRNSGLKGRKIHRLLACVLFIIFFGQLQAQIGVPFNQRDDQYRLLGLKRAKAAYESARADLQRQQTLYKDQLISEQELLKAENGFADAEVNYQQSLLAVLFEKQYVTIARAVKYRDDQNRKHVRLTLANASGSAEFKKLLPVEDDLFRSLQPDVINDIYISLLNDENAIISKPYEAKIEELKAGLPQTIDFTIMQDLDIITVNLVYSNGTTRSPKILLEKDSSENKVMIQSDQFSQEVELSGSANFDLTLELFSGQTNIFKLEVVNLPQQINRFFIDPASKARLSQFKFTESSNSRPAALRVYMPDRPVGEILIDRAISFYILVIPADQADILAGHPDTSWTRREIEALNIGFVPLEIIPRGIGKLLVRSPQLYQQIQPGESFQMQLVVKNEGSRRLDNVEIEAELPAGWSKQIDPALISALPVSAERPVVCRFIPPADVVPGRYEMRIRTTSLSDNQPVNADDKIFTAEINPGSNTAWTLVIILFILAVISGIVGFGIRLSRQ